MKLVRVIAPNAALTGCASRLSGLTPFTKWAIIWPLLLRTTPPKTWLCGENTEKHLIGDRSRQGENPRPGLTSIDLPKIANRFLERAAPQKQGFDGAAHLLHNHFTPLPLPCQAESPSVSAFFGGRTPRHRGTTAPGGHSPSDVSAGARRGRGRPGIPGASGRRPGPAPAAEPPAESPHAPSVSPSQPSSAFTASTDRRRRRASPTRASAHAASIRWASRASAL